MSFSFLPLTPPYVNSKKMNVPFIPGRGDKGDRNEKDECPRFTLPRTMGLAIAPGKGVLIVTYSQKKTKSPNAQNNVPIAAYRSSLLILFLASTAVISSACC
jgi:hypothetical protein